MIDERTLPVYIKESISNYVEAVKNKELIANEWWCDLYGAINSAQHGFEISKEVADYLREKYLGI